MTKIITSKYKVYRQIGDPLGFHAKFNVKFLKKFNIAQLVYLTAKKRGAYNKMKRKLGKRIRRFKKMIFIHKQKRMIFSNILLYYIKYILENTRLNNWYLNRKSNRYTPEILIRKYYVFLFVKVLRMNFHFKSNQFRDLLLKDLNFITSNRQSYYKNPSLFFFQWYLYQIKYLNVIKNEFVNWFTNKKVYSLQLIVLIIKKINTRINFLSKLAFQIKELLLFNTILKLEIKKCMISYFINKKLIYKIHFLIGLINQRSKKIKLLNKESARFFSEIIFDIIPSKLVSLQKKKRLFRFTTYRHIPEYKKSIRKIIDILCKYKRRNLFRETIHYKKLRNHRIFKLKYQIPYCNYLKFFRKNKSIITSSGSFFQMMLFRIDLFLYNNLGLFSLRQIRQFISINYIYVNNLIINKVTYVVQPGDLIEFHPVLSAWIKKYRIKKLMDSIKNYLTFFKKKMIQNRSFNLRKSKFKFYLNLKKKIAFLNVKKKRLYSALIMRYKWNRIKNRLPLRIWKLFQRLDIYPKILGGGWWLPKKIWRKGYTSTRLSLQKGLSLNLDSQFSYLVWYLQKERKKLIKWHLINQIKFEKKKKKKNC